MIEIPQFYQIFALMLTALVGLLMTAWSLFMIISYFRGDKQTRFKKRIHFRLAWLFLLIGIGDVTAVIREFFQ